MPPRSFLLGGQPTVRSVPGAKAATGPAAGVRRRSWTGSIPAHGWSQVLSASGPQPRAKKAAGSFPKMRFPDDPEPPEGYEGDTINDALDDLLRQAAASLRDLDGIREKLPPAPRQGKTKEKHSAACDFWKPRCRADLWGDDDDLFSDLGSEADSDSEVDDGDSGNGVDVEEDELWEFLRSACKAEPAGPSRTPRRRVPPAGPAAGGVPRSGSRGSQRPPVPPKPQRQHAEASTRNTEKPAEAAAPNHRARANGFRFGSFGTSNVGSAGSSAGRAPLPGGASAATGSKATPEVLISTALIKAQAAGPDAVRSTLKQLLLKWHPDKAPQGDSAEDVAARAESTRVLRYVLSERKRLGL